MFRTGQILLVVGIIVWLVGTTNVVIDIASEEYITTVWPIVTMNTGLILIIAANFIMNYKTILSMFKKRGK